MKTFFLRSVLWISALVVITFFMTGSVHAQCFHLGQAFDCKGLPEGTSSDHFNTDGSITLSNGQVVPGNFFDTPFVAQPVINPVIPPAGVVPPPVVVLPSQPIISGNLFPTTVDGQNALTAFNIAPRIGATYDLFGNGKAKIYSSSGQFYSKVLNDVDTQAMDDSIQKYDAIEVTLNKNFSDNWGLVTSYRYAKLKGDFQGFFGADGGLSDQSISSLFDFPTVGEKNFSKLQTYGGHNQSIRYDGIISPNWLIEASFARSANGGIPGPSTTYSNEFLGGIEFEVARSVSLGVRYIHRSIPNVLEDGRLDYGKMGRTGMSVTFDPKGNGDWVFNQSYGKYVSESANSQADSADNGPKIDINDSKRLSEVFQKILDGADAQAAPVPEINFNFDDLDKSPQSPLPPLEEDKPVM